MSNKNNKITTYSQLLTTKKWPLKKKNTTVSKGDSHNLKNKKKLGLKVRFYLSV